MGTDRDKIIALSKKVSDNPDKYNQLPYPDAYELLKGTDDMESAAERLKNDDLSDDGLETLESVVENYPMDLRDAYREQRLMALMMQEVEFWKPHWRFISDLMDNVINDEVLLSKKQQHWLRHYFYKYRKQVKDSVIYEETAPDEVYDMIDDARKEVDRLLEIAKEDYEG